MGAIQLELWNGQAEEPEVRVSEVKLVSEKPVKRGRGGGRPKAVQDDGYEVGDAFDGVVRPKTRADCMPGGHNAQRPCPFAACKFSLLINNGDRRNKKSITLHPGATDIESMPETCSLDVADRGGATLDEVGEAFGISRERVRQIERDAMRKVKARAEVELGAWRNDALHLQVIR